MRNLLLTFILISSTFMGFCQNVLFSENIGTAVSPATISVTSNPFQNSSLTFGGTADTRTTGSSTGYVGSSGSRNVFLTPTIGTNFQISSISTINRYNFKLSFGAFKSTNASNMSELTLEYSIDGIKYFPITIPTQPTGTGTASWRLISNIVLPSSVNNVSNLRLRWKQNSTAVQFRIDDIKLTNETALPIELIRFDGKLVSNNVHLYWSTASEQNSDYFLIDGFSECDPDTLTNQDVDAFDKKCSALTKMNISAKNVNKNLDLLGTINMPYGGIDVGDYIYHIKFNYTKMIQLNNSLLKLLTNGIIPMNKKHIYHLDIKESNILVEDNLKTNHFYTRLIDWGLSSMYNGEKSVPTPMHKRPFQYNLPFYNILFYIIRK